MENMLITVLTPTYNRSKNLKVLYESLMNQTNHNFQWIIVDDGSQDDTANVVSILNSELFPIVYKKKPNGGKHTAINYALPYIEGEYTFIVDSDDVLTEDAIEQISIAIKKYKKSSNVKIISFLRGSSVSSPFNNDFPTEDTISNHIDFRLNAARKGDCAEVVESTLLKTRSFPEFENEKFLSEGYLWTYWGFRYDTVYINKVIYITEYLDGGLTKSGRSLRLKCPRGGVESSKTFLELHPTRKLRFKLLLKEAMLYVCYSKFAGVSFCNIIRNSGRSFFVFFTYPLGYLLSKYWKYKHKVL